VNGTGATVSRSLREASTTSLILSAVNISGQKMCEILNGAESIHNWPEMLLWQRRDGRCVDWWGWWVAPDSNQYPSAFPQAQQEPWPANLCCRPSVSSNTLSLWSVKSSQTNMWSTLSLQTFKLFWKPTDSSDDIKLHGELYNVTHISGRSSGSARIN